MSINKHKVTHETSGGGSAEIWKAPTFKKRLKLSDKDLEVARNSN